MICVIEVADAAGDAFFCWNVQVEGLYVYCAEDAVRAELFPGEDVDQG